MSLPYPRIEGAVSYLKNGTAEIGREWFSLHRLPSGRVIRALAEMDAEKLIRDTSWTVDGNWHPIEGHVRVMLNGVLAGSTWYGFEGNKVYCRARTATHGNVEQVQTSDRPYEFLGLHPLVGDGAITAVRGCVQSGVERMINSITCSYSPNGERELLALPIVIGLTYLGPERITVPAGAFDAHRFGVRWRPEWPVADYWVFGDDFVFLKSTWSVSNLTCVLTSLKVA